MAKQHTELFVEDIDDRSGDDGVDSGVVDDVSDVDDVADPDGGSGDGDVDDVDESQDDTEDADDGEEDSAWDEERARGEIRKKNNEARNLRKRNKELLAEVTALREEKMAAARNRIAAKYGLPAAFAGRLAGDTETDWEADAADLAASLKPVRRKPKPTSNPGVSGDSAPKLSKADLFFGA